MQCYQVIKMAAGHKTSFFSTGSARIVSGKHGKEIRYEGIPGATWADFNIDYTIGGVWNKVGYLHMFRDQTATDREILLQKRTYDFEPLLKDEAHAKITIKEDGTSEIVAMNPEDKDIQERIQRINEWISKLKENEYNPFKKGWFLYSQSELPRWGHTFPRVSRALRHNTGELQDKMEYLEGILESADELYKAEGPLDEEVICSETGKKIEGARYFASYLNEKQEIVQINLSEKAFNQPTHFDLLSIPYFRFATPLPKSAILPAPLDISKFCTEK